MIKGEMSLDALGLKMVPSFCYLRDCLSLGGGCKRTSITRCRVAWSIFNELLTVRSTSSFSITSRGRVYNSCAMSAMLHASESWAPTLSDLHCLQRNNLAMIRWMCGVTTKDRISSQDSLERMQLDDLAKVLCTVQWRGHVERSDDWLKEVQELNHAGGRGRGRHKKT